MAVVSSDSHPVRGAIPFALGDADPPAVGDLPGGDGGGVRALLAAARWTGYVGMALLIGTAALVAWCWPAGSRRIGVRRMVTLGALPDLGGRPRCSALQGVYGAGVPLSNVFDVGLLRDTLGTPFGWAAVARLIVVAAFAWWAVARMTGGADRLGRSLVIGASGLMLAATFSVQGHAWAAPGRTVAVAIDALHVLAMSVWLGGLTLLALVALRAGVPSARSAMPAALTPVPAGAVAGKPRAMTPIAGATDSASSDTAPQPGTEPDLRRWSRVAGSAVVVLVVTGTLAAVREVGGWSALTSTNYGRVLLVKLAVFVVLLGLASRARAWIRRHTGASDDAAPEPPRRSLRASVIGEAGLGAVVLAITAALVATTPASSSAGTPDARASLPDGTVATVTTDEARLLAVRVETADGEPVLPVEVSAVASLPERGVVDLPIELHASGETWAAHDNPLPFPGTWRVTVTVRSSDLDSGVTSANLTVP